MTRLEVSLTRSPSSFSFVTLGKFLSLPVGEGDGPEVAQPLLKLTFHDSLGEDWVPGTFKSGYIFRLNGFVHLVFFSRLTPFWSNKTASHGVEPNYLEFSKDCSSYPIFYFEGKEKRTANQACLHPWIKTKPSHLFTCMAYVPMFTEVLQSSLKRNYLLGFAILNLGRSIRGMFWIFSSRVETKVVLGGEALLQGIGFQLYECIVYPWICHWTFLNFSVLHGQNAIILIINSSVIRQF